MRRSVVSLASVALIFAGGCATQVQTADGPEVTTTGERVQILTSRNGRYSKHGWNHYGPGYFDLDSETGVLTSHGGMGLFWYAVKELGDFVL